MGPGMLGFVSQYVITASHTGLGAGHIVGLKSTGFQFTAGLLPSHSKQMETHQLGSSKDTQLRFEPVLFTLWGPATQLK